MAFRTFKTLGEVLKAYQLRREVVTFPTDHRIIEAPALLHEDVQFVLQNVAYKVSEAAVCENIIYPVLRQVWKPYIHVFSIWSHQSLGLNDDLNGIPDYLFTKRSELGPIVFEAPYIAVVEAKRDDFSAGWAQCLLEMHAMQQLNQVPNAVFGIVSNGDGWQIGQLENSTFIEYSNLFTLTNLDELFSALTYVLETCKRIYNL
jgi:hypothetical protein